MKSRRFVSIAEMCVFAMLGSLMFVSKLLMEALPNIHLVGMLTVTYTIVFRQKALIPVYVYVLMTGVYMGFSPWWAANLYIWAILWGMTMLLPRTMSDKVAVVVYPLVCAAHGMLYGTLYAPAQAALFGLDFEKTLAWIAAGLPWDALHAAGNFCVGLLILPLARLLEKLNKRYL